MPEYKLLLRVWIRMSVFGECGVLGDTYKDHTDFINENRVAVDWLFDNSYIDIRKQDKSFTFNAKGKFSPIIYPLSKEELSGILLEHIFATEKGKGWMANNIHEAKVEKLKLPAILKYLVYPDGSKFLLAPMTFEEFNMWGHWTGSDDIAYAQFLYAIGASDLDSFTRDKDFSRAKIVIVHNGVELPSDMNYTPDMDIEKHYAQLFLDTIPKK
jgi:hypothetical protein